VLWFISFLLSRMRKGDEVVDNLFLTPHELLMIFLFCRQGSNAQRQK